MFLKYSAMESTFFLKWRCKGVRFFVQKYNLIVFKEGTNTLIFYIFDYGAEDGVECSAESAK